MVPQKLQPCILYECHNALDIMDPQGYTPSLNYFITGQNVSGL